MLRAILASVQSWRIAFLKCTLSHMRDSDRFKLRFGAYATSQFRCCDVVMDEVRGEVTIIGLTDGLIPGPIGKRGRAKTIVVYAGLADAVRKEANITICHWWGSGSAIHRFRHCSDRRY